jgi:hypothetical protein
MAVEICAADETKYSVAWAGNATETVAATMAATTLGENDDLHVLQLMNDITRIRYTDLFSLCPK